MSDTTKKDIEVWDNFIKASQKLVETLRKDHSLHKLILNDIDQRAFDVRKALDESCYFWRHDLKKSRPGATVLDAP